MLPIATYNATLASIRQAVDMLGVPASWQQTKAPNNTANMNMGIRRAGRNDEEVINAYGHGAILGTAMADSFPVPPEKFDKVVVQGEDMTINTVNPVALNGTVIMYKLVMRGK